MAQQVVSHDGALKALANADRQANTWAGRREDAIVMAYGAGVSISQIAERCSFTFEGVRKLLIRRGVELRPPHVRS